MLKRQWLPYDVEHVFEFFSDAHNLERITPVWLKFHVEKQSTAVIQDGTIFDYRLKVRGIPLHWRSLICEWRPGSQFVDVQLNGPYNLWHHTHRFFAYQGGTWIEDEIYYKTPNIPVFGILALPFVKRDVELIFVHRQKNIEKIFQDKQKSIHG